MPIAVGLVLAAICDVLWISRLAFTRDDVVFWNKKMACELPVTRRGEHYQGQKQIPKRKFIIYHQKYETPPELLEAIQGLNQEE